jgi:hypothetical protein
MKKITLYLLGSLLVLPLTFANALGLSLWDFRDQVFRPENLPGGDTSNVSAETKVNDIINFLVDLILYASGSVAVLMLIYGGVRLITAAGNPDQKEAAVKIIKWSLFGLFVVILAYAAVTNIIDLIFRATT